MPQNYYEWFEQAFVEETRQFTEAVLDDKVVLMDLESSVEVVKIGVALQESLRSGQNIWFDRERERMEEVVKASL
jgi:myo-inositol 2-dehydrogenase/D-chiro-inositol 1-dehydrogenase